jgi:hypothetical protein
MAWLPIARALIEMSYAMWPLLDEAGNQLFPELMPELDTIKEQTVSGLVFRRDHGHRRARVPLPFTTARGGLEYLHATVKRVVRAAGLRDELSFTLFRHGGLTEGADSDLSDAGLRAAGRHGRRDSCRHTRSGLGSKLVSGAHSAAPSEQSQTFCRNGRRSFVGIGAWLDSQILERLGGRTRARTWDPMIKRRMSCQANQEPFRQKAPQACTEPAI